MVVDIIYERILGRLICLAILRNYHMEKYHDLENVIRQAIADAWSEGEDYTGQTGRAVTLVHAARPDMTSSDALHLVKLWRAENG